MQWLEDDYYIPDPPPEHQIAQTILDGIEAQDLERSKKILLLRCRMAQSPRLREDLQMRFCSDYLEDLPDCLIDCLFAHIIQGEEAVPTE